MKWVVLDQPDLVGEWVMSRLSAEWHAGRGTAIGLVDEGQLVAGVVYESWNGASLHAHIYSTPGCHWTKEFLWLIFAYPFNQLGARKILGLLSSSNLQAQRFDERLGFVCEATLRDAHPDGDLLVYSMTKDQCRWLALPERKPRGKSLQEVQRTAGP